MKFIKCWDELGSFVIIPISRIEMVIIEVKQVGYRLVAITNLGTNGSRERYGLTLYTQSHSDILVQFEAMLLKLNEQETPRWTVGYDKDVTP